MDSEFAQPLLTPPRSAQEALFGEMPSTTPPLNTTQEATIIDLAAVLAQTMRNLTRNATAEIHVSPLPSYAGLEQEDPHHFVARLREYFLRLHIDSDEERVAIAAKQLRGDAARWFTPYTAYPLTFDELERKIYARYDSASARAIIKSKLYGDRQLDNESVGVFILRKRTLFSRVDPTISEEDMIALILEQLKKSIRAHLRGHTFNTLDELSSVAEKVEEDLGGPLPVRAAPTAPRYAQPGPSRDRVERPNTQPATNRGETRSDTDTARRPAPTSTTPSAGPGNRPPSPCRYCGAWHYHIDCPRNPRRQPGNSQTVVRATAPQATGGANARPAPQRANAHETQ